MTVILKKGASKKDIQSVNKKLEEISSGKKLNAKKYSGVLKKLRNEWE